jgi:hypothetical protein
MPRPLVPLTASERRHVEAVFNKRGAANIRDHDEILDFFRELRLPALPDSEFDVLLAAVGYVAGTVFSLHKALEMYQRRVAQCLADDDMLETFIALGGRSDGTGSVDMGPLMSIVNEVVPHHGAHRGSLIPCDGFALSAVTSEVTSPAKEEPEALPHDALPQFLVGLDGFRSNIEAASSSGAVPASPSALASVVVGTPRDIDVRGAPVAALVVKKKVLGFGQATARNAQSHRALHSSGYGGLGSARSARSARSVASHSTGGEPDDDSDEDLESTYLHQGVVHAVEGHYERADDMLSPQLQQVVQGTYDSTLLACDSSGGTYAARLRRGAPGITYGYPPAMVMREDAKMQVLLDDLAVVVAAKTAKLHRAANATSPQLHAAKLRRAAMRGTDLSRESFRSEARAEKVALQEDLFVRRVMAEADSKEKWAGRVVQAHVRRAVVSHARRPASAASGNRTLPARGEALRRPVVEKQRQAYFRVVSQFHPVAPLRCKVATLQDLLAAVAALVVPLPAGYVVTDIAFSSDAAAMADDVSKVLRSVDEIEWKPRGKAGRSRPIGTLRPIVSCNMAGPIAAAHRRPAPLRPDSLFGDEDDGEFYV